MRENPFIKDKTCIDQRFPSSAYTRAQNNPSEPSHERGGNGREFPLD